MAVVGPRRAVPFVDRAGPRADMKGTLVERRSEQRPCLMFVHGPDGIGRSSLVSEFFYEDPTVFDGTYIEVVARQPDGRQVQQGELLGQALRGLGLAEVDMPASDSERAEAFQRLSAGRAFLMVIKDAMSPEQVRALIPTSAPGSAVVVTTRAMERGLLVQDFVGVPLTRLPAAESRELLVHCVGRDANRLSASVIDELAEMCDGFPLLIRILGAQLVGRPHTAERYLEELRASQSALLAMDDQQRVARFLGVAYDGLVKDLKRVYQRVGSVPGPSFTAEVAAIVLETDVGEAWRLLDDLADTNLLQRNQDTGRYSMFGVVREDAKVRALEVDGPEAVRRAVGLVTSWYLQEAVPRDIALANRWRVGEAHGRYAAADARPVPRPDAIAWFEAEWPSVVACVRAAHDQGLHEVAWQLCVAVYKYLHMYGHLGPWLDSHQLGVASAQACADQLGMMLVTSQRGAAYRAINDTKHAREDFAASLDAAVRAVHRLGEQSAWEWLGKIEAEAKNFSKAFACFEESEAVIERSGGAIPVDQQDRMRALLSLQRARAWQACAEGERAETEALAALAYFGSTGELENRAKCLMIIGKAAGLQRDFVTAVACYEEAAELFAADRMRRSHADAQLELGDAKEGVGDRDGAIEAFHASRVLYVELGDPKADVVSERLSRLNDR